MSSEQNNNAGERPMEKPSSQSEPRTETAGSDASNDAYSPDKSFCNECERSCCTLAVALPEERKAIIKATRMGFFRSRKVFQKKGSFYLIKGDTCPFLKEGSCSIEHVQPLNCRIFPLALTHQGKDAQWGVSPFCPQHRKVTYDFVEHAKRIGQPLLEKHRKEGPLT